MSLAALLRATGADDTGRNVPEKPDTLAAQQRALRERRQRAQMFPVGTNELPLPDGLARVETARGVFHYDPEQVSRDEITGLSAEGRENELLGLGPASKDDVMERAARGEPVAAVVERDAAGREVKAAVATPSTAADALREMNQRRAPENRVSVEPLHAVIADRGGGARERGALAELLQAVETPPSNEPDNGSGALAELLADTGSVGAETPGFFGGVANTARRGVRTAGQAIDAATAIGAASLASAAEDEPGRIAAERAKDPRPNPENWEQGGPGIGGRRGYEVAVQKWEMREAERAERLRNNARFAETQRAQTVPAFVSAIVRRQQEIDGLPQSAIMQEWNRAEDLPAALGVLARHPIEVLTNLAVSGATSGAPALVAGAAGSVAGAPGTAAGAGLGSLLVEVGGKIVEELRSAGVDFQRPETIVAVLNDPQRAALLRDKALRRGVPVALLDALSAGVAGRLVGAPGRGIVQRVGHGAAELGIQAALGGAGEVAGSVAAGDPVSGKAVAEEMLGEIGGGSVEVATGVMRDHSQPAERARPAEGALAKLMAEVERRGGDDSGNSAGGHGDMPAREAIEPVVLSEGITKKPRLGKPAEAIAAAINARPDDDFKPELSRIEGRDVDLVAQLARYGEDTFKADEDFVKFAERMTERFGERVQAYLPFAWDAVSGERPVRDITATENPLKLENAWMRAAKWGRLFWEGSADVLRRTGVRSLADAIDRHVDFADRNLARAWSFVKPGIEPFQGIGGVARRSRAQLVFDEFEAFHRARENGRLDQAAHILAEARPETRRLIAGVQQMFAYTGQENRRIGVRVRDKDGNLRPIGFLGVDNFPRVLRDDVAEVLRDPSSNPKLWERMRAELVQNRNIESREEAGQFVRTVGTSESSNDHFGSLEKGRAARFPESWYEYRFENVIPRYVAQWAERTAQIEAFGQKIAETDRDAFDVAAEMVRNPELRRYIEATRDHAYKVNRWNPVARRLVGNVTAATTGLLLGNPYSTLRNLVGATAQTVNQFGVASAVRALRHAWSGIQDAEAAGALKADVADLLFHDDGSAAVRKAAGVALKLGGFSAAENFVRTHNFLTAKSFLRDALRAFDEDPAGRRSLQAVAFFRRHGVDAQRLAAENMRGPETERFLRGAVRQAQGSYRYSQVPLFTDGPMGRFLLQFARWGTMATRFHVQHVLAPAVIGESVPVRGADGKVTLRRVRTILPLLRSPLVAMAAGATTFALREALFGFGRSDASWDEVFRTMDDDEQRGFELALGRMINDVVMGGTMGALTDYAAMLRDAAERSRFKNPIEPPAASILKETGVLAYKLAQQGALSAQDLREWASRIVTAYRYGSALAYRFGDAVADEWAAARRHQAEQDRRFVRNAGRRFGEEAGYDMPGVVGGLPRATGNSPTYDALEDALLSGDVGEVRRVIAERMSGARGDKERAERLRQLRTSALGRQPIKPGGQYGIEDQAAFLAWARRRLSPDEFGRIMDVQRRYFTTGIRAGLFPNAALGRYAPP